MLKLKQISLSEQDKKNYPAWVVEGISDWNKKVGVQQDD